MSELSRQFVDAYYAADSTAVYSPPASAFETAAQRANDRVANAVRTAIEGNSSYQDAQSSALTEAASDAIRSEEHTSELQSLMRISYAVFCLKKKTTTNRQN